MLIVVEFTLMNIKQKLRLAVLINDMNAAGGIQRVAVNLVRNLGQCYDTQLLSVEPLRNPAFHDSHLRFVSLDFVRRGNSRLRYLSDLTLIALRLRRYVIENQINIVLAIWYDYGCIAALALPSSVVRIGCEHIAYEEAPRFWRNMRRLCYPRLDAVVGLTKADLPKLSQLSGAAFVIPNAVRMPSPAASDRREKILLSVGHLISRKGLDRLLWALQKPLHDHSDWQLAIVGGGEKGHTDWGYLDYLATLLKLLNLEGRVVLYPATKHIEEWYRRASIYVMGSRQEGLPMVLIEAKSFGLPIISFDCPTGPREIVRHEVDGFLIQDDDYAFGEAASALMMDGELWRRMSMAALEDVRARFSVEIVSHSWFELIDSLYAKRQKHLSAGVIRDSQSDASRRT